MKRQKKYDCIHGFHLYPRLNGAQSKSTFPGQLGSSIEGDELEARVALKTIVGRRSEHRGRRARSTSSCAPGLGDGWCWIEHRGRLARSLWSDRNTRWWQIEHRGREGAMVLMRLTSWRRGME
eukprot:2065991-Rhodomonas_salina.2